MEKCTVVSLASGETIGISSDEVTREEENNIWRLLDAGVGRIEDGRLRVITFRPEQSENDSRSADGSLCYYVMEDDDLICAYQICWLPEWSQAAFKFAEKIMSDSDVVMADGVRCPPTPWVAVMPVQKMFDSDISRQELLGEFMRCMSWGSINCPV